MSPVPRYPQFFEDAIGPAIQNAHGLEEEAFVVPTDVPTEHRVNAQPAPWVFANWEVREEGDLTEITVLDPTRTERPQPMGLPTDVPRGAFTADGSPGIDAIAAYLPWHFFGDGWGIYVYQRAF